MEAMSKKEKKAAAVREWVKRNPERNKENKKRSAEKNKEKIRQYQAEWKKNNREKRLEYAKKYYREVGKEKPLTDEQKQKIKARRTPYMRERHLVEKYGIDEAGYQQLLKSQKGLCAICGTNDPHGKKHNRFHVDHCHETGMVRGLLCSRCNMGLGSFLDSIEIMNKAIEYIAISEERKAMK